MRALSASALTLSVPVGYLAMRRLIGYRGAMVAAALLAVNPMLVAYATDARSYGLFVLSSLLSLWAFTLALERADRRSYLLWALAAAACIWTHYFGAFLIGAEVRALLYSRPEKRRRTLLFSALTGAIVAPLLPLVLVQAQSGRAAWIEGEALSARLLTTVRQFAMGANVPRSWLEICGLLIWVATEWRYEQVDWRGALAHSQALDPGAPVLTLSHYGGPVIGTYLRRSPISAGALDTSVAWLLVQPARGAHQRALTAVAVPPLPGFSSAEQYTYHGFQIVLERASRPVSLGPQSLAGAELFAGAGARH